MGQHDLSYRSLFSHPRLVEELGVAAQLFWLEKSRSRQALSRGTERLVPLLSGPEDGPLRQAVLVWIEHVLMPRRRRKPIPEALGLEEFKVMLEQRVEEWNRELRQEGEAALLLSQLEHKFGRVDPKTRKRVQGANAERLLDWGKRVLTAERLEDIFGN